MKLAHLDHRNLKKGSGHRVQSPEPGGDQSPGGSRSHKGQGYPVLGVGTEVGEGDRSKGGAAGSCKGRGGIGCMRQDRGGRSKPGRAARSCRGDERGCLVHAPRPGRANEAKRLRSHIGGGGIGPVRLGQGREFEAGDGGGVARNRGWLRSRTEPRDLMGRVGG